MRLAADASALVAEALRDRGQRIFMTPMLELYIARPTWSEVTHELTRRIAGIIRTGRVTASEGSELLGEALVLLTENLVIVPDEQYAAREAEARRRVPRDPNDWPTVALALALGADIWTIDRDFFGCGVAVWTTETLLAQLVA